MFILNQESAFAVDAQRAAGYGLVAELDSNKPPAQAKMRLPSRPQSFEAGLFKLSIAPVEVLNQSH